MFFLERRRDDDGPWPPGAAALGDSRNRLHDAAPVRERRDLSLEYWLTAYRTTTRPERPDDATS
jgi:hypothetical protein